MSDKRLDYNSNKNEIVLTTADNASAKKYYIIRRDNNLVGLFSYVITHIYYIKDAIERGYIPVIDMLHYDNQYRLFGRMPSNTWEFFFEQPLKKGLRSVSLHMNTSEVLLGCSDEPDAKLRPNDTIEFFENVEGQLDFYRDICHKYIRPRKSVIREVEHEWREYFSTNDRVLGVLARGTDYTNLKPHMHAIQPSVEMVIEETEKKLKEWNCNKIFVATEDSSIFESMKKTFGDICYTNKRRFVDYNKNGYIQESIPAEHSGYNKIITGRNYLKTIMMLSKCNCILGGRTSGLIGAFIMSDGFECQHVFDLGRYGENDNSD